MSRTVQDRAADTDRNPPANGAAPKKVDHFTPAARSARGKAARAESPRRVHGEWEPAAHRPDPVEEQAQTRVKQAVESGRVRAEPGL